MASSNLLLLQQREEYLSSHSFILAKNPPETFEILALFQFLIISPYFTFWLIFLTHYHHHHLAMFKLYFMSSSSSFFSNVSYIVLLFLCHFIFLQYFTLQNTAPHFLYLLPAEVHKIYSVYLNFQLSYQFLIYLLYLVYYTPFSLSLPLVFFHFFPLISLSLSL